MKANTPTLRVLAICFAIAMVDGFDTLVMSFIGPAILETWGLSPTELGRIFGAGLIGAALGGMTAGVVADRLGRKRTLLICVATFAVLTLACAFARTPTELALLRLAGGLGLGGAIPNIVALTAEHASTRRRSALVTLMFIGFPLGAVLGGALTALIIGSLGWRTVFMLGGALPLLLLPAVWWGVPETLVAARHDTSRATIVSQFGDGRAPAVVLLWLGVFSIMLLSYFLINWTPTILSLSGVPEQRAIMGAVVLNFGGIVGAALLTTIIDRVGAFRAVAFTLIPGALLVVVMGASSSVPLPLMALVFFTGACVLGAQLSIPALAARLFPMHVRGTGIGWTMGVGRIGSIIGPTVGGVLVASTPDYGALFQIAAIPCAVAALCIGAGHLVISRKQRSGVESVPQAVAPPQQ
ncbi:MAG TPA: aromatic acid/H+ symport family MFS transporter [Steroidobacter sp.]|uniref:MFS transporter n=1 Tax=Steroidobacter sp. TaxID=1978227 RepID=UPI002ED806ED